jgi:hypothetical protein
MVFFEEGFVLHPLRKSTEIDTLPIFQIFGGIIAAGRFADQKHRADRRQLSRNKGR